MRLHHLPAASDEKLDQLPRLEALHWDGACSAREAFLSTNFSTEQCPGTGDELATVQKGVLSISCRVRFLREQQELASIGIHTSPPCALHFGCCRGLRRKPIWLPAIHKSPRRRRGRSGLAFAICQSCCATEAICG